MGQSKKKRGRLYQPKGDKLTLFHTAQAGEMIPIKRNENCYRSDNWAMHIGYFSCRPHLRPMHLVKGQVLLDLISDLFFCRFAFRHWCPEYGPGPTGDERRGRERDLEGGWEGGERVGNVHWSQPGNRGTRSTRPLPKSAPIYVQLLMVLVVKVILLILLLVDCKPKSFKAGNY